MAQVVNAGLATPGDLRALGTTPGAKNQQGQVLSNVDQQRKMVSDLLKATRRNTVKQVWAKGVATNATNTYVVGNGLALSADASSAVTETFINGAGASSGKTGFLNTVNTSPLRYAGVKFETDDVANFSKDWTEIINDIDSNTTQPFNDKLDLGQNIFSQSQTTRLVPIAGVFNGFWGLKVANLENASYMKITFYVVDIERSW